MILAILLKETYLVIRSAKKYSQRGRKWTLQIMKEFIDLSMLHFLFIRLAHVFKPFSPRVSWQSLR